MGALVAVFGEVWRNDHWQIEPGLEAQLEMDFVKAVEKKKSLRRRGIPNDASPELEAALAELGDEFERESWATLAELTKALAGATAERRLLGPILWRRRITEGVVVGSLVTEQTPAILERFNARLVSNEEMDHYVASEECARDTAGLTDGQCKVFTIVDVRKTVIDDVGASDIMKMMAHLGAPDSVRLVWTVGP